jgi:import inner membrane translocase subunit TIM54
VKAETEIIEPPKVQSLNGIENIIQKDDPIENDNIVDADVNKIDETPTETISEDDEKKAFESELLERKSQFGDDEEETKKLPIPKPFISPEDYAKAKFAPEFDFNSRIPTSSEVSPFFQQPILVIPVYHLLGFLRTPERIYRFYTRRRLTEEFGKKTVALVENLYSPFSLNDIDLAKDEEEDWPKDWIKSGLEKQSEWTSAVVTDERVLSKLKVYDADRVITSEKK